jgi:hypothetical protein
MVRPYIPGGRPSVYGAPVTRTLRQDEDQSSCGISVPCGSTTHRESVRGAADRGMGHGLRRGVPVTAVMIESAGPTHEWLAMSAERAAPVVNVWVGVHRPLVRCALRDLTWGGHLGQERRRDEFDRSTVLLLYLGPGGLSWLRSRRADVLTPDGRRSVVKPGPGRREPLRPFSFPRPTDQPLNLRKDDPMRPDSATTLQLHWPRSNRIKVQALGGTARATSTEPFRVRRCLCGRDARPAR